jgi:homoserine dehydrogenase
MLRLMLFGLGTVGQGLIALLREQKRHEDRPGAARFRVVGVQTGGRGNLYRAQGLDLEALAGLGRDTPLAAYPEQPGLRRDLDPFELCSILPADIHVEMGPGNLVDGQPALDRCRRALVASRHLVLADKAPALFGWNELQELAFNRHRLLRAEATVFSGTPVLSLLREGLSGQAIPELRGILNGTTNYLLAELEAGVPWEQALAAARELGYLEADPRADVEGWDARSKVMILARVIHGLELAAEDVDTSGIVGVDPAELQAARAAGGALKLIARLSKEENGLRASVGLERLEPGDPLVSVNGNENALELFTRPLGRVLLRGPGAGAAQTASGILADLLNIARVCGELRQ